MFCPKCGKQIDDEAEVCPECGNSTGKKPAQAEVSAGGGMPFGEVIGKIKDVSAFLSLEGKATRAEYWTTYLIAILPLGIIATIFNVICLLLNPLGGDGKSSSIETGSLLTYWIGATLIGIAYIALFPVIVRRLRDIGLNAWVAVAYLGVSILPFHLSALAGIFFIVAGVLPTKVGAPDTKPSKLLWPIAIIMEIAYVATLVFGTLIPAITSNLTKVGRMLDSMFG